MGDKSETQSEDENNEETEVEAEAKEPPREAKPENETANEAEEIIDVDDETKEDEEQIGTRSIRHILLILIETKALLKQMPIFFLSKFVLPLFV